uniref:Uncharacterized protein n=1 Tax=Plectus sambesii TaxID=2011161 RepID=A0A914X0K5_9BILA
MEAKLVVLLISASLLSVCSAGPTPVTGGQQRTPSAVCESRLDRTISVVCDGCVKEPLLAWLPPPAVVKIVAHECCKKICTYETIKSLCCHTPERSEAESTD